MARWIVVNRLSLNMNVPFVILAGMYIVRYYFFQARCERANICSTLSYALRHIYKKKYHWLETELVRTASLPPSIEKNKHMLCLCSVLHMRSDNFVSGDFDAFLLCLHAESCIKSSKTVVLGCEEKEATFSTKWVSTPLRHPLKD